MAASTAKVINIDWSSDEDFEFSSDADTPPSPPPAPPLQRPGKEVVADTGEASSSAGTPFSKLVQKFVEMGFPRARVLEVIDENGHADENLILSVLLTYSNPDDTPQQQVGPSSPSSSDYYENCMDGDDLSDSDSLFEDEIPDANDAMSEKHKMLRSMASSGSLSDDERKILSLADMGYPIEEVEIALKRCGPEATIPELTDFIYAAQMSREADISLPEDNLRPKHMLNGYRTNKKRKFCSEKKKNAFEEETMRIPRPMIGFGVPNQQPENIRRYVPDVARGPPYFYYENVALAPKGTWDTISRHLFDIEPEFVDSKYFCAAARKRGYVHNLPIENRFPLVPLPPMTVYEAFPLSRRYWPAWDVRDKMNCIQTALASAKLTERLRTVLDNYDGIPPESVQKKVLEECRKWNLVWVGKNKTAPMEPDEMEMLLGFPKNHTRGISRTDRNKSLGNSFQVDTVAYHLSVLKALFPNGLNVLSLFSGIGGGEVALNRLGIKMKNVVSVEKLKVNRDIVRSWWEQSNQEGNLIHFDDVHQVDYDCLHAIIDRIGGFDLIIGGSPCNNLAGSNRVSREGLEGSESVLFYEYVRILETVKVLMGERGV